MRRSEISRRLKAARWLAGGEDENGTPKQLGTTPLSTHSALTANRITKNRLEEIEQCKVTPRALELTALAEALGMPDDWFSPTNHVSRGPAAARELRQLLADLGLAPDPSTEETPEDEDESGPQAGSSGGDA